MAANPPPLVSPIPHLDVRAVLDRDSWLTAGLAIAPGGQRVVLLVGNIAGSLEQRDEFLHWGNTLTDVSTVARTAAIADYGHTEDGRPFLATYTHPSLADHLRLVGRPDPHRVRGIGASIADALAATHSHGLVHGAVCPATVQMADGGVRLGGFGTHAPGLAGPLGLWAFTAPEHRVPAAAGEVVGSPAGDVFALAATVCVALSGVIPWSDPSTWADEAELPTGPEVPRWVTAIRDALSTDPDRRPDAFAFAAALRGPDEPIDVEFHGKKVDLRTLIPRQVRRLAAYSIDAMADGVAPALGRVVPGPLVDARSGVYRSTGTPPVEPRENRLRAALRAHRALVGIVATIVAVLVATGVYVWTGRSSPSAAANGPTAGDPAADASAAAIQTLARLNGARLVGQAFLRGVAAHDATICASVHGTTVVTTARSAKPVTCTSLVAHDKTLLGTDALAAMKTAVVSQAVGYVGAIETGPGGDPDPHAFISLPYVPALADVVRRFEMVLTFHDDQWWIVEVTFG